MKLTSTLFVAGLVLAVIPTISPPAHAAGGELDNETTVTNVEQRREAVRLPGTLVVRVNRVDNSQAVLHSEDMLPANSTTQGLLKNANFIPMGLNDVGVGKAKGELDRDSSTDSWRFSFRDHNRWQPVYYYGGYNYYYQPYWAYTYGPYYYYCYGWQY